MVIASVLLFFCTACGAGQTDSVQTGSSLGEADPLLQSLDQTAVEQQLKASADPGAAYLLAELYNSTGRPENAFSGYLEVLRRAGAQPGYEAEAVAAAMATVAIRDRISDGPARISAFVEKEMPGLKLPHEALFQLRTLYFSLALHRGNRDRAARRLAATGCMSRWQIAGPFDPDFAEGAIPAERASDGEWPSTFTPSHGRSAVPVETRQFDVCHISPPDPGLPGASSMLARTAFALPDARTVHFRLETDAQADVIVDGTTVFSRCILAERPPSVQWFHVRLDKGVHRLTVHTTHPELHPVFSLSALTSAGSPVELIDPTIHTRKMPPVPAHAIGRPRLPQADTASRRQALLQIYTWWGDMPAAWALAETLDRSVPRNAVRIADLYLETDWFPADIAYVEARQLMEAAFEKEPSLYPAALLIARHETAEGRAERAMRMLHKALQHSPDEPELHLAAADVLRGEGRLKEAREAVARAGALLKGSCQIVEWQTLLAQDAREWGPARRLAQRLSQCRATSPEIVTELSRAGRFDEAAQAADRIAATLPMDPDAALEAADAWMRADRFDNGLRRLETLVDRFPWYTPSRLSLSRAYAAAQQLERAARVLEEGISLNPEGTLEQALFEQNHLLDEFRIDGLAAVRDYLADEWPGHEESVWVLDRTVHLIGASGSRWTLTHWIAQLRSQTAIADRGEIEIAPGEQILTARTIRRNGQILTPEPIDGKASMSLPGLQEGDFAEFESLQYVPGSTLFPGGFDTDRFYFRDFSSAFRRSETVVLAPASMALQFDGRGDCPAPEIRQLGELQAVTFSVRNLSPAREEPGAPVAAEYLPSMRVTANATTENLCAGVHSLFAHRTRPDPMMKAFVDRLVLSAGGATRPSTGAEAALLYEWLVRNVENDSALHEESSHIFWRRRGNRARLFQTLLAARGIDSRIALVVPAEEDHAAMSFPDLNRHVETMVLVDNGDWVYLDADRAPYGFIPPSLRNQPALLMETCDTLQTGVGRPALDATNIVADFRVDRDGSARGTVIIGYGGVHALYWRDMLGSTAPSGWKALVQDQIVAASAPGAILDELEVFNLLSPDKPLTFSYSVTIPRFATKDGEQFAISLPFAQELARQIGGLPERTTPLVLATDDRTTLILTVDLPDGAELTTEPTRIDVQSISGFAVGDAAVVMEPQKDGGVTVFAEYELHASRIMPEHYSSFLDFARARDQLYTRRISYLIPQSNP